MTFTILCWQAEGTATTTDSASRGLKVAAEEKVAFSQHGGINRLTWRPESEFQKAWDLAPAQVIADVMPPRRLLLHLLFLLALSRSPSHPYHLPTSYPSHFLLLTFLISSLSPSPSSSFSPVHYCRYGGCSPFLSCLCFCFSHSILLRLPFLFSHFYNQPGSFIISILCYLSNNISPEEMPHFCHENVAIQR